MSPKDLHEEFVHENARILKQLRGGGYWLWKPYIIRKTLEGLGEEDFLCYCDADYYLTAPIDPVIEFMLDLGQDVVPFAYPTNYPEKYRTKRDVFIRMGCDKPKYADTPHRIAKISLWKGGSPYALRLADEWLHYAKDERMLTDLPSKAPNHPHFIGHLHDQSIFSLLTKKHGLRPFEIRIARHGSQTKREFLVLDDPSRELFFNLRSFLLKHIVHPVPFLHSLHKAYKRYRHKAELPFLQE